jgi:hypothetical protein
LISNKYAPAADGRIEYEIPKDFDGKIGFVFYKADIKNLKIAAWWKLKTLQKRIVGQFIL